jgi:hypothetical protein
MSGTDTGYDEDVDIDVEDVQELPPNSWRKSVDFDLEQRLESRKSITSPTDTAGPDTCLGIHIDKLREELKTCLSTASTMVAASKRTFMHWDTREIYPNPGLKINNYGNVGLPLSPQDIDAIKQAGHRSPSGEGAAKWQVEADDLACLNPQWKRWMDEDILPRSCDVLGVPPLMKPYIRAELYEMSLHEEGAQFEPPQDMGNGMFATLAICLPVEHQGGELVVKHDDGRRTWSSSKSSASNLSFSAWYGEFIIRLYCSYAYKY